MQRLKQPENNNQFNIDEIDIAENGEELKDFLDAQQKGKDDGEIGVGENGEELMEFLDTQYRKINGEEIGVGEIEEELVDFLDAEYIEVHAKVAVINVEEVEEDDTVDSSSIHHAYRFLEHAAKNSEVEVLYADEEFKEVVFYGEVDQIKNMYEDPSWTEEFDDISPYHSWDDVNTREPSWGEVEVREYKELCETNL